MDEDKEEIRSPRSLWRNHDFLLLWAGQAMSIVGSNASGFALTLFILDITHSPAHTGFVGTLAALPYLLFSLPAGRPGRSAGIFFQSIGEAIPFLADTGEHTGLHMRALMDRARVFTSKLRAFFRPLR